jgi:protein involved in polysaccharide export with SLBB domain
MADGASIAPRPKLRWYQFSLRSLMLLVTAAAFCFGWIGYASREKLRDRIRPFDVLTIEIEPSGYQPFRSEYLVDPDGCVTVVGDFCGRIPVVGLTLAEARDRIGERLTTTPTPVSVLSVAWSGRARTWTRADVGDSAYKITAGDELAISSAPVHTHFFGAATVDADGNVGLDKVRLFLDECEFKLEDAGMQPGTVRLAGLTCDEAEKLLGERLGMSLWQPLMHVERTNWNRVPDEAPSSKPYRLRPGDLVEVFVRCTPPERRTHGVRDIVPVEGDGRIPLGSAHARCKVGGLTLDEARAAILQSIAGCGDKQTAYIALAGWKAERSWIDPEGDAVPEE